jgi:hypothetical protein
MTQLFKEVTLTPNTNRLRQLVRDHGDVWLKVGPTWNMPCFNGELGVQIKSMDGSHIRNVPLDVVDIEE